MRIIVFIVSSLHVWITLFIQLYSSFFFFFYSSRRTTDFRAKSGATPSPGYALPTNFPRPPLASTPPSIHLSSVTAFLHVPQDLHQFRHLYINTNIDGFSLFGQRLYSFETGFQFLVRHCERGACRGGKFGRSS